MQLVLFAYLDFAGDLKFLHSGVGVIEWGNEDWFGVGTLGGIEPIKEEIGYTPTRTRLVLNGVAGQLMAEAIYEPTWGRLCEIYFGTIDDNGDLNGTPQLLLRGRMGPPEAVIGANSAISVVAEDIRSALDRVNGLRATLLDHQAEVPGDLFYGYLAQMLDHKFTFAGGVQGANNVISSQSPVSNPIWGYGNWLPPGG